MEESITRKERLKAMRLEASEDGVGDGTRNSSIVSKSLANPLTDAILPLSIGSEQQFSPRFDYYTDPMAAFSANKRSSKVSHQISPDFTTHPSPVNPSPILPTADLSNSTPDLRPFQAQGPCYGPGPVPGPGPGPSPFGGPGPMGSPNPYNCPGPVPGPFMSPVPIGSPNPYNMPQGNISHWGRPGGSSPNFFPNASPGYGQGNRPTFTGQGRGYKFDNSPHAGSGLRGSPYHNSGRGRSSGLGSSSSSGGSPGFARSGTHNSVSAKFRPNMYYKKSMVEDPWKRLKPILWKQTSSTSNSWLPKSLVSKKPRVSVTPDKYKSGQSLAEYLAASFSEATNEADDNED